MSVTSIKKFTLLNPIPAGKSNPQQVTIIDPIDFLDMNLNPPVVAVDTETEGLHPKRGGIVVIAFAWDNHVYTMDVKDKHHVLVRVLKWLQKRKWFGHNTYHDACFISEALQGEEPNILGCSMILFRMLANEKFSGQRWSLDYAINNILQWGLNTKKIIEELCSLRKIKKAEMHKLIETDWKDFLIYCGNDADASWQLMKHLRSEARRLNMENVIELHDKYYNINLRLHIEQRLHGIKFNVDKLNKFMDRLKKEKEESRRKFLEIPEIAPHVKPLYSQEEVILKEKKTYAKKGERPWENISEWTREFPEDLSKFPAWTKQYGVWYKISISKKIKPAKLIREFNLNSSQQLHDLLYETLFSYEIVEPPELNAKGDVAKPGKALINIGKDKVTILFKSKLKTDSEGNILYPIRAQLPTDKKILPLLGDIGHALLKYKTIKKILEYTTACSKGVIDGRIYPAFDVHNNQTGRGAGSQGFNILQQPKIAEYFECFEADPGYVMVSKDLTSLEQVVLAELSEDPALMELYNTGKPHQAYLFNAMAFYPERKDEIASVYYNEEGSPTKETVEECKKKFKDIYPAAKKATLSLNYGAGPSRIYYDCVAAGIQTTKQQCKAMHENYWKLYAKVKEYEEYLKNETEVNGGYFLNGLGYPMCMTQEKMKDILNSQAQSTGHHILIYLIYEMYINRKLGKSSWLPVIIDYHDESIVQVKEKYLDKVLEMFDSIYDIVNSKVNGTIKLTGSVDKGATLAHAKGLL